MAMVACGDAGNADGGDLLAARNGGARAHQQRRAVSVARGDTCLLYTSDAADE